MAEVNVTYKGENILTMNDYGEKILNTEGKYCEDDIDVEFVDDVWPEGAKRGVEPYIEEIYDSDGNLIDAKLYGYTKIRDYAFHYGHNLALTSLPDGITSIGDEAFAYCSNLALTSLPDGITSIGDGAFYNCSSLTTITFKGTPTVIARNAFAYCFDLTINVPWAEGEVVNAPWGATNATINYNYTG